MSMEKHQANPVHTPTAPERVEEAATSLVQEYPENPGHSAPACSAPSPPAWGKQVIITVCLKERRPNLNVAAN